MRSRGMFVLAIALSGCAIRDVSVGRDDPPLRFDAGQLPDAGFDTAQPLLDAAPIEAEDAAPAMPMIDAAPLPPPPVQCTGTKADCDHDAANGCEVDLATDSAHCGKCETACQYPDCACKAGVITTVCPAGHADCDGDSRNGCEVDTGTSMQHCGSCGRLCHTMGHDALAAVCMAGHCRITCQIEPFGQGDCDDNPDNGCETNLWTNDNCGQCGVKCTCVDGVCR